MIIIIKRFGLTKFISGTLIKSAWVEHSTRPISGRAGDVKAIEIISFLVIDRIIRARAIGWIKKMVWGCLPTNGIIQSVRNNNFPRYHPEDNDERDNAYIAQYQSSLPIKSVRKNRQCGGYGNAGCKRHFSCCNHVLIKLINLVSCYANSSAQFFADLLRILIFFVSKKPPVQGQTRKYESKEAQCRVSRFKSDKCGQKTNENGDEKRLNR